MSLEEKVGQVLMVHFHGESANEDARTLIQNVKVGGVIYYNWSNGLYSPKQVRSLSLGLQKLATNNRFPIPLLIAVDQEGGVVARLQSGFTCFPGNRALGETKNPHLAKEAAFAMGQEMQSVQVNMNLAPVVDVNSNPENPVIGVRSFGDSPERVIAFGRQSLEGFKQAQVIATLKHFPGYGDVAVDPHEKLPVIYKSKKELEEIELRPFRALAKFADAIMTAHILVPALDDKNCATLSAKTLRYLRENIDFQGVIVADSLVMDGVLKTCPSVDEAAIRALDAGCDLLILGGKLLMGEHAGFELTTKDVKRVHHAIVEAVQSGRVSEQKLDAAVTRILKLKKNYLKEEYENHLLQDGHNTIDIFKHRALAQKIASLALQVTEKTPNQIAPLSDKAILIVAPKILENDLQSSSIFTIGRSTDAYFFSHLNPSSSDIKAIMKKAENRDIVIVCSYNAWKNSSAISMTKSLLEREKPLILLSLRDPLDAKLFSKADLIFQSFSPTKSSIQAICNALSETLLKEAFFSEFSLLKEREEWEMIRELGQKALADPSLDAVETAQIHARLASNAFYLGNYKEVKVHATSCQAIAKHFSDPSLWIRSLYLLSAHSRALGNLSHDQTKFQEACKWIDQAIALLKEDSPMFLKAKVYFNAGAIFADDPNGNLDQAADYMSQAMDLFKRASCKDDYIRAGIRKGKILLLQGNITDAMLLLTHLEPLIVQEKTRVHLLYVKAQILMAEGEKEEAKTVAEKAVIIAERLGMAVDKNRLEQLM
ncbi:MAG: glycoside hydrolase family 3 N-terminal domain-containing protein [Chlamydiota bacterium]